MLALKAPLSLILLAIVGCGPGPKQPAAGAGQTTFQDRFGRELVAADWTPNDVSLTCGTTACPPQVGVLMIAVPAPKVAGEIDLRRCTASLIAPDQVLTSAHCLVDGAQTFFISTIGAFLATGVTFRKFAGRDERGNPRHGPDVAVLKLEKPIVGMTPLSPAQGPRPSYRALTSFVVNASGKNDYRIDRLECAVRKTPNYPYDIDENPDVLFAYDCDGQPGNSGAPLFGPDGTVEAVLQDIGLRSKFIVAGNLRCLPIPGPKPEACVKTSFDDINLRQQRANGAGFAAVKSLPAPEGTPYKFSGRRFKLSGGDERYEVVWSPECLRADAADPTEITYPSELVTVTRDARGVTTPEVIERRQTVARVIERQGVRYRVEATWVPPFGALEKESAHPRVYLGKTFSIDLPRCAG